MANKYIRRAVSFAAAAVTACSYTVSGVSGSLAAAVPKTQKPSVQEQQNTGEPVPVLVELNCGTVMDGAEDAGYLETAAAAAETASLRRAQDAVIAEIRKLYPELEVRFRYTTLVNGFSCSLPENLIGQVRKLPAVSNVTVTGKLRVKEELATALNTGDFPSYYDETGCTGEGQVIAVIDSEIDVTHPMFEPLADGIETKLDKSDIDAIQNGVGFNVGFETDRAYYSNKIPFAIDYSEKPYNIANTDQYHGTHVCGIAAGNRFTDANGREIHGIAPDAQIVFMGMDNAFFDLEEVLIAAMEDATKLNVDAINMSLGLDGDPMDNNMLTDAINQAEAAGITVCIAAGNSDNGELEYAETHYADNPDVSWMNRFINEGTHALAVASADNPAEAEFHTLTHNGQLMPYEGCMSQAEMVMRYLGDELDNREYEYEYCGLGYGEDFAGKDLTGKIALVDRGELYFEEKAENAMACGAVGVIVIQNTNGDPLIISNDTDIAMVMVSKANGEILRDAAVKTVSFTDETVRMTRATGVSDYTSWGIHSSMELRPDIMGIGGSVESAAYESGTAVMSGTSMATPYLTGCSAVLKQYLLENGCTLTGSDLSQYIRNLMMTGASPMCVDDMFVTPRRQGAGLVNLNTSIHSKILLTGPEGESKLSLRDNLGTDFSFPLTLTNISGEDVSFSSARMELTTDDAFYSGEAGKYQISGQQRLKCTASFGDAAQIAAGETKTVDISVSLDVAQAAALKKIFTNGFFIEGYLLLEGAENSADISIPLVGFSDNFAQIPAFGEDTAPYVLMNCDNGIDARVPYCKTMKIYTDIVDRAVTPEGHLDQFTYEADYAEMVLSENATEEERKALQPTDNTIYISPNDDGAADIFGIAPHTQRHCIVSGADVVDQNGRVVAEGLYKEATEKNTKFGSPIAPDEKLNKLAEGAYKARIKATFSENPAEKDIQVYEYPLYIDKTVPKITEEKTEVNGRQIAKLTATDNCALDGLIVLGYGTGNPVGSSRPMQNQTGTALRYHMYHMVCSLSKYFTMQPYAKEYFLDYEIMSPFHQCMIGSASYESDEYFEQFSYMDFIPAEPDADGSFTVSYDVTDLEKYEVIALDRAFNSSCLNNISSPYRPNEIPAGVYQSENGLYVFTEDTLRFIPLMNSYETTYHYTLQSGCLTLIEAMENIDEFGRNYIRVWLDPDGNLCLEGDFDYLLGFQTAYKYGTDYAIPVDTDDPDHYLVMHGYEAEENYLKPYLEQMMGSGVNVGPATYDYEGDAVVRYKFSCYVGNRFYKRVTFTVDLKTGIAMTEDGTIIDLLHLNTGKTGDVDCNDSVDVADAVLLARVLAEDREAVITEQGLQNADCNHDGQPTSDDVVMILRAIARLITLT